MLSKQATWLTRGRMGQQARARAVRDFDLKDQGFRFVELYQEVLSKLPKSFGSGNPMRCGLFSTERRGFE